MIISDSSHYYNAGTGEEYGPTLYALPRRDQYGRDLTHTLWFAFLAVSKPLMQRREDWFMGAIK